MVKLNRSNDSSNSNTSRKSKTNRKILNVSFCAELELNNRNTIKIDSSEYWDGICVFFKYGRRESIAPG